MEGLQLLEGDQLVLRIWNLEIACTVSMRAYTLDKRGRLTVSELETGLIISGVTSTLRMFLPAGTLVSACVFTRDDGIPYGNTYCLLNYEGSDTTKLDIKQQLIADYVSTGYSPSWPNFIPVSSIARRGFVYPKTIANPSPGSEIVYSILAIEGARLCSFRCTLTTSAVVATRVVRLVISSGAIPIMVIDHPTTLPASTTRTLLFLSGFPVSSATGYGDYICPLPSDLFVPVNSQVRTSTLNMYAGDQYSDIIVVTEKMVVK